MYFTTTALALLSSVAFTNAAFSSLALRSASPIHFQPLQARGGQIWVGGNTSSYCPSEQVQNCPPGNVTAFVVGNGAASMAVEVPGGQQLYVGPKGALRYTQAHSAYMPTGSYTTGFYKNPKPTNGAVQTWGFDGGDSTGFLACPVTTDGTTQYKVYANVEGFNQKNCLGFDSTVNPYKGSVAAWQYT